MTAQTRTPPRTAGRFTSLMVVAAMRAASAMTATWREAEQTDAGDLAGEKAAGRDAGEQHFDDAARLLFDDSVEDHRAVGGDGHEQQHRHDERRGLVVGAAAGDLAEFDVVDGDGREERGEVVAAHAGGVGAVLDGADLDGGGDDGFELVVGVPLPFEAAGVDDEDVDGPVADGLLCRWRACRSGGCWSWCRRRRPAR